MSNFSTKITTIKKEDISFTLSEKFIKGVKIALANAGYQSGMIDGHNPV